MFKKILKDNLTYINSGLILFLILFLLISYLMGHASGGINSVDSAVKMDSGYNSFQDIQNKIYNDINETYTYVVGITSSKNMKFYMEDPSLLQGPGAAIEKNAKLDEASGILLGKGYVLTNKHVVENADAKYAVVLYDGTSYDADKIWKDKQLDLAVLKINISDKDIDKKGIKTPKFLDVNQMAGGLGEMVLSIGKRGEDKIMLNFGIISSKNKKLTINENIYINLYQTNFLLKPGFSGGPLLNLSGQILGMNTAINQSDFESFVLPISNQLLSSTIRSIEKYGDIVRGLVGIKYDEISDNKELQKKYNLTGGILLNDIVADLPANKAGLQINDIIISINNVLIDKNLPFLSQIYNYLPGDELKLQVWRDNSLIETTLILDENF